MTLPPGAPGFLRAVFLLCLIGGLFSEQAQAQFATGFTKISSTSGGFPNILSDDAKFGIKSDVIGDLDNDGTPDIAVGATNQGFNLRGSVFVIFLTPQGTAKATVEIVSPEASDQDSFGSSVAGIGDLDNDGNEDIAVGAGYDDPDGNQYGAIWIFFLNSNGTVKAQKKINHQVGNFSGSIAPFGNFGTGMVGLGDLDGDGVEDIAVGADLDDGAVGSSGAVYILFMNTNGTVKSFTKISGGMSGFPNILNFQDYFGYGLGNIGDLDNDGVIDLAVGAHRTDDGGTNRGALHIVFLNTNGTVKSTTKISANGGGFIQPYTGLGYDAAGIGDIDGDGTRDLIVGSNDSNNDGGVVWYLMMNANGTVKTFHKISFSSGGTNLSLDPGDFFGGSMLYLGDINSDGIRDIGIGAFNDDDGGTDRGAFWISTPPCIGASHAGNDLFACNTSQATLTANNPGLTGTWSLHMGSGQIQDPSSATTLVTNLGIGVNRFIWDLGATACIRRDTVTVNISGPPTAAVVADKVYTCTDKATINGIKPTVGVGIWVVKSGQATILSPDSANTIIQLVNRSPVVVTWKVSHQDCSDETDVIITPYDITKDDFPNVITPNGDGKNDSWRIISGKPATASVRVLNRWGAYVFESNEYGNNWTGEGLGAGVYFYRVSVSGCPDEFKGTVQIIH